MDIHTKLMNKYRQVPEWWFWCILVTNIALTVFACEYYNDQLQLPWWGVLLACVIAFFFTLPIGIITAITNQVLFMGLNSRFPCSYTMFNRVKLFSLVHMTDTWFERNHGVHNWIYLSRLSSSQYVFQSVWLHKYDTSYNFSSRLQTRPLYENPTEDNVHGTGFISFISFQTKYLFHRPTLRKTMVLQIVGTFIAGIVYLSTAWWLMETIPDICESTSSNSIWTCPSDHVFYDASVIWGLIGPRRIFGDLGTYAMVNWFFLLGAIAPVLVWLAHKAFPNQDWIKLINMPILIAATGYMPPATAVNYTTWIIAGFLSGYVWYRYRPKSWQRFNYVLSGALDAGLAFMGVLLYLFLGLEDIKIDWWGNDIDGCPYASCPTNKRIVIEGCPVIY